MNQEKGKEEEQGKNGYWIMDKLVSDIYKGIVVSTLWNGVRIYYLKQWFANFRVLQVIYWIFAWTMDLISQNAISPTEDIYAKEADS